MIKRGLKRIIIYPRKNIMKYDSRWLKAKEKEDIQRQTGIVFIGCWLVGFIALCVGILW